MPKKKKKRMAVSEVFRSDEEWRAGRGGLPRLEEIHVTADTDLRDLGESLVAAGEAMQEPGPMATIVGLTALEVLVRRRMGSEISWGWSMAAAVGTPVGARLLGKAIIWVADRMDP